MSLSPLEEKTRGTGRGYRPGKCPGTGVEGRTSRRYRPAKIGPMPSGEIVLILFVDTFEFLYGFTEELLLANGAQVVIREIL
jgi:hypothetical protein